MSATSILLAVGEGAQAPGSATIGTGETVLFWVLAPVMILAACGVLFSRRAVYAAMGVVLIMICLAVLYIAQGATFLGVTQVVVYTGAIMMLFLFVLMLVGIDPSDSLHETIAGQRWIAALAGLGLVAVLAGIVTRVSLPDPVGVEAVNADSNPVGVARLIFSDHVFAMELTGLLLIVAAVGAVTLTHGERLGKKFTQEDVQRAKMSAYAAGKGRLGQLPAPGVYARSNAADLPALSADGEPLTSSVPRVLRVRGQARTIAEVSPELIERLAREQATGAGAASADTRTARLPAMRGDGAPVPYDQPAAGSAETPQLEHSDATTEQTEEEK